MKLQIPIFSLYFFSVLTIHGQTSKNSESIKQKISTADSVLLISHKITAEFGIMLEADWDVRDTSMNIQKWNKLHPPYPKFMIDGKLNAEIIRERFLLVDSNKNKLIKILLRKIDTKPLQPYNCDEPRHSILIYKNGKLSFLDICFECKRIHTSNDIHFDLFDMDNKKWNSLISFFETNGLTKIF